MFFGIGFLIYNRYKSRKIFFENLLHFCDRVLIELGFQNNTISKIIDIYCASYGRHFASTLNLYQNLLNTHADITHDRIAALIPPNLVRAHEIALVVDFFFELGRHGIDGEKRKTTSARATFHEIFTDCAKRLKTDAAVFFKLFVFMGAAAVILCV